MTTADRIDAATALVLSPFVGGCLFLIVCAVAVTVRAERRLRESRRLPLFCSDLMAPWAERAPGELPEVEE